MKKSRAIIQISVLAAIVVVINLISDKLYFRLDFTADKRYTLSKATKDILNDLDGVVTVTAYFSENLPPQLTQTRKEFEDLLVEYEKRSNGNLVYRFVSPNDDEELQQEAQQNGIGPILVNVTENDKVQQIKAYMGAFLQMGESQESIPLIQPGSSMEYSLTTAIKKVSITDKPKIGLLKGHGEAGLSSLGQVVQQLNVLYDVEPFEITDTTTIPSYYKTIAIVNPKDSIPDFHFDQLDTYLASGGNIFLAYSNVEGDLSGGGYLSKSEDIGIKKWLKEKGIEIGDQFVTDAQSASVSVRQQQGFFVINTQVQFPYFPIVQNFEEHPVTKGLENLLLPFVSPLNVVSKDTSISYQPLALSSDLTGLVNAPTFFDINKRWKESDFTSEPQVLAMAAEGPLGGTGFSKMIVVSNGDFAVSGEGQQRQQLNPDNVNFATNAIDWLSDDTGLIDLRTKGVTSRPLESVEEGTKNLIKYGNVLAPIFIILIYGLVRRQQNIRKRQKWLQDSY